MALCVLSVLLSLVDRLFASFGTFLLIGEGLFQGCILGRKVFIIGGGVLAQISRCLNWRSRPCVSLKIMSVLRSALSARLVASIRATCISFCFIWVTLLPGAVKLEFRAVFTGGVDVPLEEGRRDGSIQG